ncbi:MAG: S-layer homology domain-containing protein [Ruminococcaceae bacterium]|nr:S-layer homology domain-containing protein [Oscillospiraceae bacterium]
MGIVADDGITFGKGIEITSPAGGKIGKNSDDEYTVVKRNGEVADEIEISKVSTSGNKGGGSSGSSSNSYTVGGAPIKPIPRPGILPTAKTFDDVHSINHWAKANVDYVLEKGLMKGVSENMFDPEGNVTRAMLVTVLYRNEGEPAVNRSISFGDIDMGAYYANAVSWAKQNGIVVGITENEFAPDESITREQIAAIMYRYAIYKGMEAVTLEENLHFEDSDKISEYAVSAMNWAVGSGLMKGKSESALKPQDLATRAECAVILHRFVETNK